MKLSAKIKALAEKFPPKITLTVVADYTSNDVTSLSAFETDSTPHLIMSDSLSPKDLSDALEPFSHKSIGDKEGLIVVLDTAFSEDDSYGLKLDLSRKAKNTDFTIASLMTKKIRLLSFTTSQTQTAYRWLADIMQELLVVSTLHGAVTTQALD